MHRGSPKERKSSIWGGAFPFTRRVKYLAII